MKKAACTISLILILLLGLAACGYDNDHNPIVPAPTADKVIRDVQKSALNLLLGEAPEKNEKFPLSPLILDDWEVKFTEGKAELEAEITATVGDKLWKSEERKTFTVHYVLDKSNHWAVQGINVNDPVIRTIPRIIQTIEPA